MSVGNIMIQSLRSRYDVLNGRKLEKENKLKKLKKENKNLRRENHYAEKALILIQKTANETQEQLRYQLTELPKLALSSVFDDPYEFDVQFEIRRGKTEVDFYFVRDGERFSPKENTGLGAVDVAGMSLRPALWSMKNPRSRATIFLDEPFKHLKGEEANKRALAILSEICKPRPEQNWPGLQIVMIADERASREDLLEVSDCVYEFSMKKRETRVRRLK